MTTTYLGLTLVDVEPDRGDGADDKFARRTFELNSQTGARTFEVLGPADALVRTFQWVCFTRTEVKELRDFIDACLGRSRPFWMKSWQRDMIQTANSNGRFYICADVEYATRVFPIGNYRRHVSIRADSGTYYQRRVINAADNGNGTETITIESGTNELASPPGLVQFLRYCRLDEDETRIDWESGSFARASLAFREIPNECPA